MKRTAEPNERTMRWSLDCARPGHGQLLSDARRPYLLNHLINRFASRGSAAV